MAPVSGPVANTLGRGTGSGLAMRIVWPVRWGRRPRSRKPAPRRAFAAGEALARVRHWQAEIDLGCSRAEIARREGLSRARVTQLFRLLELPDDTRQQLLDGGRNLSIRAALASLRNAG